MSWLAKCSSFFCTALGDGGEAVFLSGGSPPSGTGGGERGGSGLAALTASSGSSLSSSSSAWSLRTRTGWLPPSSKLMAEPFPSSFPSRAASAARGISSEWESVVAAAGLAVGSSSTSCSSRTAKGSAADCCSFCAAPPGGREEATTKMSGSLSHALTSGGSTSHFWNQEEPWRREGMLKATTLPS